MDPYQSGTFSGGPGPRGGADQQKVLEQLVGDVWAAHQNKLDQYPVGEWVEAPFTYRGATTFYTARVLSQEARDPPMLLVRFDDDAAERDVSAVAFLWLHS